MVVQDESTKWVLVVYPDGFREFRMSQSPPQVRRPSARKRRALAVAYVVEHVPGTMTVSLQRVP